MVLTSKQEEGLKIAVQRYKDKEPYTVIAGYAGLKNILDETCEINFYFFLNNIEKGKYYLKEK